MREAIAGGNPEVLHAESFLGRVYDDTSAWLRDSRNAQVIKTFDASTVPEWERQSTYPPGEITLGIDISKALLLRDTVNTYGIVLGRRKQGRYDLEKDPSLLFGFFSNSERVVGNYSEETPIDQLRTLVNKGLFHYRRAEFYYSSYLHGMEVDCWIDAHQYGGHDLRSWEGKDKVMSPKVGKVIIDTVKRLVRNYDPI